MPDYKCPAPDWGKTYIIYCAITGSDDVSACITFNIDSGMFSFNFFNFINITLSKSYNYFSGRDGDYQSGFNLKSTPSLLPLALSSSITGAITGTPCVSLNFAVSNSFSPAI